MMMIKQSMTITGHMFNRTASHFASVLDIDEEAMEDVGHRSTMGQNCSQIIINFNMSRLVDLSPVYERYSVGDRLLTDKEVERAIYLGGITDGGLSVIMAPMGETPDLDFESL